MEALMMTQSHRILRSIRFEQEGSEFVLVLTATLGSEISVERLPLGQACPAELIATLESALADLNTQHGNQNWLPAA
jgi:hypothetical protein